MNLLQFIIIVSWIVFFFVWIDLFNRKKINIIHLGISFICIWSIVFLIAHPVYLDRLWLLFWTARWADVIVYWWIIFLSYFALSQVNYNIAKDHLLSELVSWIAIKNNSNLDMLCDTDYINEKDDFLIMIRVYNEASVIEQTLESVISAWYTKILCIDDWSKDFSVEKIKNIQKKYKNSVRLHVLEHVINRGPWAPNKTWFEYIRQNAHRLWVSWIVMFDADWQMDIANMVNFQKQIKINKQKWKNIDVYFWSRFKWSKPKNMPLMRKILLQVNSFVSRILYTIYLSDHHCWYRVLSIYAVKRIQLYTDWWHYANELLEQVVMHKLWYNEIPVSIKYTPYSLSKTHGQKNMNSIFLWIEMLYKKFFFK